MLRNRVYGCLLIFFSIGFLTGCGGEKITPATVETQPSGAEAEGSTFTWPGSLPADATQPWEVLDENGKVASSINADSEFSAGVERYDQSPAYISDNGESSHVASGAAGSGDTGWAVYRLEMGGTQPGAVSTDVNLGEMSNGGLSSYYIGLSNYGEGAWDWHGPFTDSHVRLSLGADVTAGVDYLSGLGNHFVSIVAHDGAVFDVVGVGANPVAAGDTTPPDAPVLDSLTPVAGGLDIEWLHAGAADLAGYRIYHAPHFFADASLPGVKSVDYLAGGCSHLLQGVSGVAYVRVSAVDISGNESNLSDIASAYPLTGDPPVLVLTTDITSGLIGASMNLTATGADSYDWDLDGDGVYEIAGDATGAQSVTPGAVGIIRPAVRGTSGGGDCVACGSVSLLIGANARPIAQGFADPASGPAPLAVTFTSLSSDFDGTIIRWAWDFDGDKTYDYVTMDPLAINPPPHVYTTPGVYNAKFRAWDDDDTWDVDTVTVLVQPGYDNEVPVADLTGSAAAIDPYETIHLYATGSSDPDGTLEDYEWDFDDDGIFNETDNGEDDARGNASTSLTPGESNVYTITVRVTDDDGATDSASYEFAVHGWVVLTVDSTGVVGAHTSLAVVDGCPAISYYDFSDLKYARAATSTGRSVSDWTQIITVDSTDDVGTYTSLAVVDGCPAVSYCNETNGDLKYARAITSTGGSAADWTQIVTVDSTGDVGTYTSLAVVDGCPAISYYDETNDDLKYARATTCTGGSAPDWAQIVTVDSTDNVGAHSSLAVVDGCPAISYCDDTNHNLKYARAATSTGGSAADWTQLVIVDSTSFVGGHTSLAVVDGCPAIGYYDFLDNYLKYARATTSTGGNASDWTQFVTVDSTGDNGQYTSLIVVDGCPAISYFEQTIGDLEYARATTSTGGSASDWTKYATVDSAAVGVYNSLAVVDGCPAISYFDGARADLKYAICF